MSKRPAPPTAASGAADADAADDRSSRNPDGAIEYRGGRFDCRMCAHESFGVKKKVKHSGIGRCRLELARVARAVQIADHAAASAAAVAGGSSVVAAAGSGLGSVTSSESSGNSGAAAAALTDQSSSSAVAVAPPCLRRCRIMTYDRSLGRWVAEIGGLVEERIPALITIALNGTHDDQQHAVDSLWRLSSANECPSEVDEHLSEVVRSGLVPPLVALLRDGTAGTFASGETHGKEIAAGFLRDLALFFNGSNWDDIDPIDQIVCAGAIPPLVALVRDGDLYAATCAVELLGIIAENDGYSEGVYTTPYGGCGCAAVIGAGGIAPLIALARDPSCLLAQQSVCVVLANFGECDPPTPVLVREGIAALVREGAIPLLMAFARGRSDSELSHHSDIERSREHSRELSAWRALSSLSTADRTFRYAVVAAGGAFVDIDAEDLDFAVPW